MFEIQQIDKSYQQGDSEISVLRGLNLSVGKGETVSIIGQSGSGKSTLLSILCGLENVDAGILRFEGKNLTDKTPDEWTDFRANSLGIVFQHFHLVPHLTAIENVLLPLEIQGISDFSRGKEMLVRVGLEHRMNHFPNQLSGGEMQRVAVARALVSRPKIVLADEPSGNLDADNAKAVIELMFDLVKEENTSLVLVTHDLELAKKCGRSLKLEDGQLNEGEF